MRGAALSTARQPEANMMNGRSPECVHTVRSCQYAKTCHAP